MSFTELRAFNAVARNMSFAKAAEELHRTQPTVTMQIAQLERYYNVELIVRNRGKLTALTPLGEQLFELTRSLIALEQDTDSLLRNAGSMATGTVRISATAPVLAIRLIKAFNSQYKNVDCPLQFGNSEEVLESILDCSADFGILGGQDKHPDCITIPIAKPEIVLVAHKDHPCVKKGTISREEFAEETLLIREQGSETRQLLTQKMDQHNYKPARYVEIGRRSGAIAATVAGMGMAAFSIHEIESNDDLRIIKFESFRVFGVNHAICLKRRSSTMLIKILMDVARENCSQTE